MNKLIRFLTLTFACGVPAVLSGQGQGLPTSQPALVTIVREQVKVGRAADHARIEAGWPAAFGRANSPDYYLAMVSLTGTPEAWYIIPAASNAAYGEQMKRYAGDAATTAELDRLARADAEVLEGTRTIQAMARPDLSRGAYPDLSKQRFWEISVVRVRPGHEADWDAGVKAYLAASDRAASGNQFRTYEVTTGMTTPTYIIFASVADYAEFDRIFADGMKTFQSANPAEQATIQKFGAEGLLSWENNRFRLDPKQSYVSRETRATDPAFWGTMPAATRAPARRP